MPEIDIQPTSKAIAAHARPSFDDSPEASAARVAAWNAAHPQNDPRMTGAASGPES